MKKSLFTFLFCLFVLVSTAQDLLSQKKSERLFKSGVDLLSRNDYGAALRSFDEYLTISPANDARRVDVIYYRALCGLYLYHADGEKNMADFTTSNKENPHAITAHFDLGNFFYGEKNFTKANDEYGQVNFSSLSAEQQNIGHFRYGYSLFNQKKLKESLDQFTIIKTSGGQYGPAASYYAGFIEYSQAEYEAAHTDLKRAGESSSYAKIVPYLIANVYYKKKSYDELLAYLENLKGVDGLANQEELSLLKAEAEFRKGDFKNATEAYGLYLDGKTGVDPGVLYRAGYSAFSTGQDNVAMNYLKTAATSEDSVGYYASYLLGAVYLKSQQKPLALTAFDNARHYKKDPRLAEESAYQYAKISYDLGRSDQAIGEFERFLTAYPKSTYTNEVRELLSHAYVNANNYNKAIEYIEALPSRSPTTEMAYQKATYLKGSDLFNKGDYAQAVSFFEKSLKSPADPVYVSEANFWLGEAYSIGKKYPEAIGRYTAALPVTTNMDMLGRIRYGLGYAFYNQQKYDKALDNFRESATKSAKSVSGYNDGVLRLADCYYATKGYADALANYRKAIQLNSSEPDYAHLQMGVILGIQAKYTEAFSELDQVPRNYPQSRFVDEAIFERAQLNFEQGNYAAAVTDYTRLIASDKPSPFLPYAYQRRAAAYYNLKDYSKTVDDYVAVLEKYPSHPVAEGVLSPLQEALTLVHRSSDFDKYLAAYKAGHPDAKGIEGVEFEAAKNSYFSQDYQKALTSFANYISTYPESPHLVEAKYYRAETLYRLKDFTGALNSFSQINADNSFSFTNKIVARIAELEFKQGGYERAIPQFRKLAANAATKKDQSIAWTGLMESFFLLAQYDSSDVYARLILEKGKVNAGSENKASLYLGKSAMARGDYETAKDEFLSTLNSARDEYGAEAKYSLAEIFYATKEYKSCYETLVSLNTDFAGYPDWVGKSYLLMADNYTAMGEIFQAKGTLKSLIANFPAQPIKDSASEKLKKLEADEAKKQGQSTTSDSTTNK